MFIGHYAVALGAKRAAPTVSLGVLFLACQLADLVWPTLVLLGIERVEIRPGDTVVTPLHFAYYPYSHSLLALALWGAGLALVYRLLRHAALRSALVLFALVLSHWVLDFATHRPDMPLTLSGSTRLGLGLWNSLPGTIVIEGLLFAVGLGLYLGATRATDRIGRYALWGLVVFLLGVYALNLASPPPPSVAAVTWSAQALWLLVAWAFWIDRHRTGMSHG